MGYIVANENMTTRKRKRSASGYVEKRDRMKPCEPEVDYCGSTLLAMGDYYSQMTSLLRDRSYLVDEAHVQDSLFTCGSSSSGPTTNITFAEFCGDSRCQKAGDVQSKTRRQESNSGDRCWSQSEPVSTSPSPSASSTASLSSASASASASGSISAPAASPTPHIMSQSHYLALVVGVGVALPIFCILVGTLIFLHFRRKRERAGVVEGGGFDGPEGINDIYMASFGGNGVLGEKGMRRETELEKGKAKLKRCSKEVSREALKRAGVNWGTGKSLL